MSTEFKKYILITAELANSEVGVCFQNLGFELISTHSKEIRYSFVIDNVYPELKNVPRMQINESISDELKPMVCGRINKEMFDCEQGRALLSSYFHDALEFDLVDRYSKDMSNIYSIKIHEHLNMGYFVDSVVIEAYKAKFDISDMRAYLNTALSFSFKKVESNANTMPVDMSFSHNGEAFAVQISILCDKWNGISEIESYVNELTQFCNYFDTTYFNRTNRLTISALFFKNSSLKSAKANFFTEVVKRSPEVETKRHEASDIYSGLVFNEPIRYQAPRPAVIDPATKLLIARKFSHFIKDYRQRIEDPPIPLGRLLVDDVINYLAHYPKQDDLQDIDSEVKHLIFKILMNDHFSNEIDDFVQVITDSYPHAVIREIQKIMGDRGLEDIENIITGQSLKPEDGFITRVRGNSGEKGKSDLKRIIGADSNSISDNDLWEIRKAQLNIKDHLQPILSTSSEDSDKVENLDTHNKEKLEEVFSNNFLNPHGTADVVKEKLESQLNHFKKIMYKLKKEILKLQSEKLAKEEADKNKEIVDYHNVLRVKSSMERSLETIKNKDYLIEKMKKEFDQFIKNKDQNIEALEQKLLSTQGNHQDTLNTPDLEKVDKLENENKTLNFKLDLANKKVNIVTEKMNQREAVINAKSLREIEALKDNLKVAQSIIDEMKIEKAKLEMRISDDQEQQKMSKVEIGTNKDDEDKDGVIQALNIEKKALEEKFRTQGFELKKVEQKLKFSLSRLESATKKSPAANSNLKSPEAYAKQLDQASTRMAEVTAEVLEKRREIVKVKQENSMMSTKITELEKKLLYLEKKIA